MDGLTPSEADRGKSPPPVAPPFGIGRKSLFHRYLRVDSTGAGPRAREIILLGKNKVRRVHQAAASWPLVTKMIAFPTSQHLAVANGRAERRIAFQRKALPKRTEKNQTMIIHHCRLNKTPH